jgi:hypothetical protein
VLFRRTAVCTSAFPQPTQAPSGVTQRSKYLSNSSPVLNTTGQWTLAPDYFPCTLVLPTPVFPNCPKSFHCSAKLPLSSATPNISLTSCSSCNLPLQPLSFPFCSVDSWKVDGIWINKFGGNSWPCSLALTIFLQRKYHPEVLFTSPMARQMWRRTIQAGAWVTPLYYPC